MPDHFALPFRFSSMNVAAVNEQDSTDDVAACVEAILRYRVGERDIAPHFGIDDPTFSQAPVDAASLIAQIEEQEPRARPALYRVEDSVDAAQNMADGINIVRVALGANG